MKEAKNIIVNILRESFPLIDEEKRDAVAEQIVKELGVTNVRILNAKEHEEKE